MNENINLAEILRDCPKGLRLYSSIHGPVEFLGVDYDNTRHINVKCLSNDSIDSYMEDGHYLSDFPNSEAVLFPNKKMRDWSKFWKKGDILVHDDTPEEIYRFDGYLDKTYMNFKVTSLKADGERSTLTVKCVDLTPFKLASEDYIMGFFAKLHEVPGEVVDVECVPNDREDEPRRHFNPYDKVLVRQDNWQYWVCGMFSHISPEGEYVCVNGFYYKQCLPYEGNEHLVGTTKSPEHE